MQNPINLDEIYNLEFEKVKNELKQYSIEKLKINNGKKLFVKLRNLQMELVSRNDDLVRLKTSETSFMADKYTIELTTKFKNNIDGYEELPITHFVEDYLDKLKLQFKDSKHSLPKNIKLNEKNTVILIANWYSTSLFIDKLNLINENEKLERMIELINSDEIIKYENYKIQEDLTKDELETKDLNGFEKINWLGTQVQLAELFLELKRKGWINEIRKDLIKLYFTKSNTIEQVLKPGKPNKETKENLYEGIYKINYIKKFDTIKFNSLKFKKLGG